MTGGSAISSQADIEPSHKWKVTLRDGRVIRGRINTWNDTGFAILSNLSGRNETHEWGAVEQMREEPNE